MLVSFQRHTMSNDLSGSYTVSFKISWISVGSGLGHGIAQYLFVPKPIKVGHANMLLSFSANGAVQ